jgi:hypothetical protein
MEALILGRSFSHADLFINIGGVPIVSISDITVKRAKQKEFGYGTGTLPVGYGEGKYEPVEVSFTMDKVEAENLNDAAPGKDVLRLAPFDMPITSIGPVPRLIVIKNIMIQDTEETSDVDTKIIKAKFTAIASHVKR